MGESDNTKGIHFFKLELNEDRHTAEINVN